MVRKVISVVFILLSTVLSTLGQEVGLQLYSLRHQLESDVPTTLEKVKAMGFKDVELSGTYGLSFADFMKLLAKNELRVVSFGAGYDRLERFPQSVIDEARALGAQFIVCSWIPHEGDKFTKDDVDKAVIVFNNAGKLAAQNGLLFCYHPHGYEFQLYNNKPLFEYMMEQFNRYVHFQMDVFWIKQSGQDPVTILKKYPSRFISLQLKDRKKGTKDTLNGVADEETNVVLGSGDVGIDDIMREAKALGIQYYFIEDESSKAEKQIPLSLTYLKKIN